ncbi:MAG: hypothetical protein ACYS14_00010 [Planctomycetota bacterium]
MKRSLIVLCAAALLATLPLASVAEARRHGRHARHGRPGWPNRMMSRGSCRRANPARRGLQGWQGWRGRRGWRDCQDTQPEEVMVPICHVLQVFVDDVSGTRVALGVLTEVPESEVAEHEAHGDRRADDVTVNPLTDSDRELFYIIFGINDNDIGNANLWFWLLP